MENKIENGALNEIEAKKLAVDFFTEYISDKKNEMPELEHQKMEMLKALDEINSAVSAEEVKSILSRFEDAIRETVMIQNADTSAYEQLLEYIK